VSELDGLVEDLKLENNQLISDLAEKQSELTALADESDAHASELAEKDRALAERDQRISALTEAACQADEEQQAIRDRIASLEQDLREERECTVNLSEIANERREQITELSEKLDEAQERYEEAKWHLERAARFERLVIKRRKLIDSLIAALRAKQKANVALKAGLDGLRRYKAKSEQQEQKLLVRIEELSGKLRDADEQLMSQNQSSRTEEKLRKATETISSLEGHLDEQAKLIEKREGDLRAAKIARETAERQASELAELTTMREKDQSLIEALQLQVDSLQSELMRWQETTNDDSTDAPDASRTDIRKRDAQISDLKRRVKAQEKEIAKLEETVAGWQKKYEFLSTDAPSAYQSASGEK
jgi:chromosome segregation ATPase